ncbi:hypothetical protein KI387_021242, partial [Taxus chinensis]
SGFSEVPTLSNVSGFPKVPTVSNVSGFSEVPTVSVHRVFKISGHPPRQCRVLPFFQHIQQVRNFRANSLSWRKKKRKE